MKEWKMESENLQVTPAHLAALIKSVEQGIISQKNAKQVFAQILKRRCGAGSVYERTRTFDRTGFRVLETAVREVLQEHTGDSQRVSKRERKGAGLSGGTGDA